MASTHKHIRSSTANKRPTTAIADGQIALNTNASSPGLFFKDSTGASIIKIGPVHVGSTAPNATPGAGGSSGNSTGEIWLDNSLTPVGVKIWDGSAWVNATPVGSTTVQGLLELATSAETQTGTDTDRAVTPAGLQSKLSDSTSTTSSTTIASSTAVKSAYDLANAALPKSGGTITGNLEIGTTGSLSFEGSTADAFETTIAVTDPTADRTITLPDTTGTVVTTGDSGTVTSTMIADGTIVNADVNASAAIAGTKISPDFGSQNTTTTGTSTAASFIPTSSTVPTNGVYLPAANSVAISTNGSGRLFVDASGDVIVGATSTPSSKFCVVTSAASVLDLYRTATGEARLNFFNNNASSTATQAARISGLLTTATAGAEEGALLFSTTTSGASSEKLRITSAGLVGIGTTSPSSYATGFNDLVVGNHTGNHGITIASQNNSTGRLLFADGTGGTEVDVGEIVYNHANNSLSISTNRSTAATIDSSGRLLVGTSTSYNVGSTVGATLQAVATSSVLAGSFTRYTNDNDGAIISLGKSRGTSAGSFTVVQSGDIIGNIRFAGADGGDLETQAASIRCEVDGTPGANDMPGRIVLSTTADGASSPTEAMRIRNDGQVLIGATSDAKSGKLEVTGRLAVLNGKETIQTDTATYTASTSATAIIQFDSAAGGFFGAELFVTLCDTASPSGTIVQKVYVAARGSGANVTAVSVSQSDILRQTGETATFTGYLTWTAAVVSNRARLSVTATQTSGAATLTVHCNGAPFSFLI